MSSTVQAAWPTRFRSPATLEPSFPVSLAETSSNYNIGLGEENCPRLLSGLHGVHARIAKPRRGPVMDEARIASYAEFWPFYLRQHARPATRAWHYLGTILTLFCVIYALLAQRLWLLPAVLVAGYGPAWIGHFTV